MEQKRKYTKRKHLLTREMLDRNNIRVEFNEDGQPIVYKGERELKQSLNTTHHKYGKDMSYYIVSLYLDGKQRGYMVSNVVWVYFNSSIPEGYDVDHINDDPLDNRIENLQLLTRKENLRKRGYGRNQNTANWTDEEVKAYRKERAERQLQVEERKRQVAERVYEEKQGRLERKQIRQQVDAYKEVLRDKLNQNKLEREYYKLLYKQATTQKSKKWIRKRIDGLMSEKHQLNKLISSSKSDWEIVQKMKETYDVSR